MNVKFEGLVLNVNIAKSGKCYVEMLDSDDNCRAFNIELPGGEKLHKEQRIKADLICSYNNFEGNRYLKVIDVNKIEVIA